MLSLLIGIFLGSPFGARADTCTEYPAGTSLSLQLVSGGNAAPETLLFKIVACENNNYELAEVNPSKTDEFLLKGYFTFHDDRDTDLIAFVNVSDANGLNPLVRGEFKKKNLQVFLKCPPHQKWGTDFHVCEADNTPSGVERKSSYIFHGYQYLDYSYTSGKRGQSAVTGPDHFMLVVDRPLSAKDSLSLNVMSSLEHVLVKPCTPQLMQPDGVDCMGPHDYLINVALRNIFKLGDDGQKKIFIEFGPRDEAAFGPTPFMGRDTAFGVPGLEHGVPGYGDSLHDQQWVTKAGFQFYQTLIEASVFKGETEGTFFGSFKQDSWSARVNQKINSSLSVGFSVGNLLVPNDNNSPEHNRILSAWAKTNNLVHGNAFKTESIWSNIRDNGTGESINSFLEEFLYQVRRTDLHLRVEIDKIRDRDLNIIVTDGKTGAQWVKAVTGGYEYNLVSRPHYRITPGIFGTLNGAPADPSWKSAYGYGRLWGAWTSLKISWSN